MVAVDELVSKVFVKLSSDGGLAAAHKSDQHNIAQWCYVSAWFLVHGGESKGKGNEMR